MIIIKGREVTKQKALDQDNSIRVVKNYSKPPGELRPQDMALKEGIQKREKMIH